MEGNWRRKGKKIDLEEFKPAIYSIKNESWFHFIVCLERMTHKGKLPSSTPPSKEVKDEFKIQTYREVVHPVAILLSKPAEVLYGLPCTESHCVVQPTAACKIGETVAKAALSEAYRGIDEIQPSWPKRNKLYLKFARPTLLIQDKALLKPNQLKTLRNVTIWTLWDSWEADGLSTEAKVDRLNDFGFPCTANALRRVKEEVLG